MRGHACTYDVCKIFVFSDPKCIKCRLFISNLYKCRFGLFVCWSGSHRSYTEMSVCPQCPLGCSYTEMSVCTQCPLGCSYYEMSRCPQCPLGCSLHWDVLMRCSDVPCASGHTNIHISCEPGDIRTSIYDVSQGTYKHPYELWSSGLTVCHIWDTVTDGTTYYSYRVAAGAGDAAGAIGMQREL